MPRSGEANRAFGIYKTACCNAEIVIPEHVTFPQCLKHNRTLTEWHKVAEKSNAAASAANSRQDDPAA